MALPKLLGFEVPAQGRGDDFAAEEFLNELPIGALRGRRRRGEVRVLAVHAGDPLAKGGELLLDILHSLFLCPI
jgi:hypothetical protein